MHMFYDEMPIFVCVFHTGFIVLLHSYCKLHIDGYHSI